MQRRSALTRLLGSVAGLSFGKVPNLESVVPVPAEPFSVTLRNLAQSSGTATCRVCHVMWDSLHLTPAGVCLSCADRSPEVRAEPQSDPFWALSPHQVRRLEAEIERLAGKLKRMEERLGKLEGSGGYAQAVEEQWKQWHALQRELHLLHLLRAASRQFGTGIA